MTLKHVSIALSVILVSLLRISAYQINTLSFDPEDVVTCDVAVIGGGAAGVYTALRLQDYNKSVVIVEKKQQLGGHAETYVDPVSNILINLGVVDFPNDTLTLNYFARFNVTLTLTSTSNDAGSTNFVDFTTGEPVNFSYPSQADQAAAFKAYSTQLEQYLDLQAGFNLTYPVADELLLPFGMFVEQYNLSSMMPTVYITNEGYAPLLNISTLYMFKYLNAQQLQSEATGFLRAANNTMELYDKALDHFGSDVLLNSSVIAMNRSTSPVQIVVQTPVGQKLIIANKIVSTPPPMPDILNGYDLSADEERLFSQFFANGYYSGLLNNTGLNGSIFNVQPSEPYGVPAGMGGPGVYTFCSSPVPDLMHVFYAYPMVIPDQDVQDAILGAVNRVQRGLGIEETEPNFVAYTSHAPFNLMVSNEAIQNGFYKELYALQGARNTFYNGAAWQSQSSWSIWQFTEGTVLPAVLGSL